MNLPGTPDAVVVTLDADGLIAVDLPCASCGYLLRTQPPDGVCPECGKPVQETIEAGDIRLLPLDWLRRIQAGSVCLAVSIPLTWLFGLGVLVWILGVLTLCIEPPKNRPEFKRLQRLIAGGGVGGVAGFIALFAVGDRYHSEWPIAIHLGVVGILVGVHLGGVLRYAARVCGLSMWPTMNKLGNSLAIFGLIWPCLAVGSVVLLGIAFSLAWGGTAPSWLDPLLVAVGIPAVFGGFAFAILMFVFWIVIAARMNRIRKEAATLHRDTKPLAT